MNRKTGREKEMTKRAQWVCMGVVAMLLLTVSSFAAPPNAPQNPFPADTAVDIQRTVVLSWDCTDPDLNELVYEVWMRRVPLGYTGDYEDLDLFRVNNPELPPLSVPSYTLEQLQADTTYVWRILAMDDEDPANETWGPIWSFTTTTQDPTHILSVFPNPAGTGDVITIRGYGFLEGTPKKVKIGGKFRPYRYNTIGETGNRILYWTDDEIKLRLPKYRGWPPGTSKMKTVSIVIVKDVGRIKVVYGPKLDIRNY